MVIDAYLFLLGKMKSGNNFFTPDKPPQNRKRSFPLEPTDFITYKPTKIQIRSNDVDTPFAPTIVPRFDQPEIISSSPAEIIDSTTVVQNTDDSVSFYMESAEVVAPQGNFLRRVHVMN